MTFWGIPRQRNDQRKGVALNLAGQFGAAGFGLRVLLEGALGDSVKFEVYPARLCFTARRTGRICRARRRAGRRGRWDCRPPAMKAWFNTEVLCAVGTERIIAHGMLEEEWLGFCLCCGRTCFRRLTSD